MNVKCFRFRWGVIVLPWAVLLVSVLAIHLPANASQVAIFDFDDRLDQQGTIARYIEKKLILSGSLIKVVQYSGKSNRELSVKVLQKLDSQNYDLIITVTSDALIIAHHTLFKTPVLYTNVNNPLSLGFRTLGPPGGNISGASYYVSIEKQLALYKKLQPGLNKVGFIFDRNNMSRKVELSEARQACQKLGLAYEIEIVSVRADLNEKVRRLIDHGAQAIVATSSDLIYNNIPLFAEVCEKAGVPVYSFSRNGVQQGAVAALAADRYRMVDELLIPMALKVLREKVSPGTMPAAFLEKNLIYLNAVQIDKLKLKVPSEIASEAIIQRIN